MIGLLKKLFGAKPAEQTAEVPYKVEAAPMPVGIEAVVAAPTVVVAEAVVEQTPPAKTRAARGPAAPKKEAAPTKSTVVRKPKAKPAV